LFAPACGRGRREDPDDHGTANPAHLAENLAVGAVELPPASLTALDKLSSAAYTQDRLV
jgi:hypothetical protein